MANLFNFVKVRQFLGKKNGIFSVRETESTQMDRGRTE